MCCPTSNNTAKAMGPWVSMAMGGGVYTDHLQSSLSSVVLTSNKAWVDFARAGSRQLTAIGGGLASLRAVTLTRCNVSSNQAYVSSTITTSATAVVWGGGLFVTGRLANLTAVYVVNNTAAHESALGSGSTSLGGGVFVNATCRLIAAGGSSLFAGNRVFGVNLAAGGAAYVTARARFLVRSGSITPFPGILPAYTAINTVEREVGAAVLQPSMAPTSPTAMPTLTPTPLPTQVRTTCDSRD